MKLEPPGRRIDLNAFLGDTPREVFETKVRDRERLYVPGALTKAEAATLLGLERFDELATSYDVPYPDLELIENGMPASPGTTKRNRARPGALADKLSDGATIRFRAVAELDPRVKSAALALGDDLDAVMQVNAFLTPARSKGFVPHYDEQDIWIVQTYGSKIWSIHGPGSGPNDIELPLNRSGFDPNRHTVGPVVDEIILHEGDTMYLPRGTGHSARCTDQASVHLSFAFIIITLGDVLRAYVDAMHIADYTLRKRVGHRELTDLSLLGRQLQEHGNLSRLDEATLASTVRQKMQDFVRSSQGLSIGSLINAIDKEVRSTQYIYRPETVWRLVNDRGVQRLHVGSTSYQMGEQEIGMIRSIKESGLVNVDFLRTEYPTVNVQSVLEELEKVRMISRVIPD